MPLIETPDATPWRAPPSRPCPHPAPESLPQRLVGGVVHFFTYHFVLKRRKTAEAFAAGFRFVVPPTVFHPSLFKTGEYFAEFIAGLDLHGRQVADIGTGSGILALAAARAGASQVSPSTSIRMPRGPRTTTPASTAWATASPASAPICCPASPPGRCSTSSCRTRRTLPASRATSPTAPGTAAPRIAISWSCSSRRASGSPRRPHVRAVLDPRRPGLPADADGAGGLPLPAGQRALDHDRHLRDLRTSRRVDRAAGGLSDSAAGNTRMPHIEIRDVSLVYDTPAGQVTGVQERQLQHRAVRVPLHRRAVRLRQIHAAQHHRRLPAADRRRDPDRRQGGEGPRPGPRRGVPGFRAAVSVAHRARQRRLRPGDEGRRQGRARGDRRGSSSSWSSWKNSPTPIRIICPAACSSASRSPARSPTIPRCC